MVRYLLEMAAVPMRTGLPRDAAEAEDAGEEEEEDVLAKATVLILLGVSFLSLRGLRIDRGESPERE